MYVCVYIYIYRYVYIYIYLYVSRMPPRCLMASSWQRVVRRRQGIAYRNVTNMCLCSMTSAVLVPFAHLIKRIIIAAHNTYYAALQSCQTCDDTWLSVLDATTTHHTLVLRIDHPANLSTKILHLWTRFWPISYMVFEGLNSLTQGTI